MQIYYCDICGKITNKEDLELCQICDAQVCPYCDCNCPVEKETDNDPQ